MRWPTLIGSSFIHDKRGNLDLVEATLRTRALYSWATSSMGQLYFRSAGQKKPGDNAQACAHWRNGARLPRDRRLVDALKHNNCATTQ